MAKKIYYGYYFVAFIDIVGQRDKLKHFISLPSNDSERQQYNKIISETSEYVKALREHFDMFFEAASQPTGLLDHLEPEKREWIEKRKQTPLWRRGFSDSYFITVPCWYESSWGSHSLAIYSSLFSLCSLFIWSLAYEKPFRGAVEVGLGTEISSEEVYGPVNVRVIELEKEARYPRVIVGDGLMDHLENLEKRCLNNLEGMHTKMSIQYCRNLITTDHTDTRILDPMGEGVKLVTGSVNSEIIKQAYKFVVRQEKLFCNSDGTLCEYYTDLRKYCESRLSLWGLNTI